MSQETFQQCAQRARRACVGKKCPPSSMSSNRAPGIFLQSGLRNTFVRNERKPYRGAEQRVGERQERLVKR